MGWTNDYGNLSGSGAAQNPAFGSPKSLGKYFDENNWAGLAAGTASTTGQRQQVAAGVSGDMLTKAMENMADIGKQSLVTGGGIQNTGVQGLTGVANASIAEQGGLARQSSSDQAALSREEISQAGALQRQEMVNAQADKARKAAQPSTLGKITGVLGTVAQVAAPFLPGLGAANSVVNAAKGLSGAFGGGK